MIIFAFFLLVISLIDLKTHRIPNLLIYPAIILALVFNFHWPSILCGLLLAITLLGLSLVLKIGMGDVKLAFLIGLVAGWPLGVYSFIVGVVIAGVVSIAIVARDPERVGAEIAYAPYLSAGVILILLVNTCWPHLFSALPL